MTAHNLFDDKDYDKGLYWEQQITVTHKDRLALIVLELLKLLAYQSNESQGEENILGVANRLHHQKPTHVSVRVYYTSQWSEPIPVVGWLGQKS